MPASDSDSKYISQSNPDLMGKLQGVHEHEKSPSDAPRHRNEWKGEMPVLLNGNPMVLQGPSLRELAPLMHRWALHSLSV